MATVPTQIPIDSNVKQQATELFTSLDMNMSGKDTLDAMTEARRISKDPDVKGYTNMSDLIAALEAES